MLSPGWLSGSLIRTESVLVYSFATFSVVFSLSKVVLFKESLEQFKDVLLWKISFKGRSKTVKGGDKDGVSLLFEKVTDEGVLAV